MKTPFARSWFAICCLVGLAAQGCVPGSASRPVTLQRGGRQLAVEVVQDGRPIGPTGGVWRLKARPFELRLSGDLRWASYHATIGRELAGKLAALGRPMVFFAGTASAVDGNALHVLRGQAEVDEAAELFTADEGFFVKQWGAQQAQAAELAARLRRELGSAPAIACFGHVPFPCSDRGGSPRYFLENACALGGERVRGTFKVESVGGGNESSFGSDRRVHMLVFLESPIDKEFRRVSWSLLTLEFEP